MKLLAICAFVASGAILAVDDTAYNNFATQVAALRARIEEVRNDDSSLYTCKAEMSNWGTCHGLWAGTGPTKAEAEANSMKQCTASYPHGDCHSRECEFNKHADTQLDELMVLLTQLLEKHKCAFKEKKTHAEFAASGLTEIEARAKASEMCQAFAQKKNSEIGGVSAYSCEFVECIEN